LINHLPEAVCGEFQLERKEESAMKNYESPEAVELGQASSTILGTKDLPLGDDILGPDYPMIVGSVVDSD